MTRRTWSRLFLFVLTPLFWCVWLSNGILQLQAAIFRSAPVGARTLTYTLAIATLVLWVTAVFKSRGRLELVFSKRTSALLTIYLAWLTLSTAALSRLPHGVDLALVTAPQALLPAMILWLAAIRPAAQVSTWARRVALFGISILAIANIVFGTVQYITNKTMLPQTLDVGQRVLQSMWSFQFKGTTRATGVFSSGNNFGVFLLFVVALWVGHLLANRRNTGGKAPKMPIAILSLAAIAAMGMTITRTNFVMGASLLVFAVLTAAKVPRRTIVLVGIGMVITAVYVSSTVGAEQFRGIWDTTSLSSRLHYWSLLWSQGIQRADLLTVLFGQGTVYGLTSRIPIDNVFLGMLSGHGLVAAILHIVVWISIWVDCAQPPHDEIRIALGLFLGSMLIGGIWQAQEDVWLYVGFLVFLLAPGPVRGNRRVHSGLRKTQVIEHALVLQDAVLRG